MSELAAFLVATAASLWSPSVVRVVVRWDVPPVEPLDSASTWVLPAVGAFAVVLAVVVAVAVVLIRRSRR